MENYIIVLFKNKKKKKILKKFVTFSKAQIYYNNLLNKNKEIIFEVNYQNADYVEYEIAIVGENFKENIPVYLKDNFGRNIKVILDENGKSIIQISKYKLEESLFDVKQNKKIYLEKFIKTYLKSNTLKIVSVLNNKVIVQEDEIINLFSLKNERESIRFIDSLSKYFFKIKRSDCLFITDTSTPQKKYLLNLLEQKGYNKSLLYRKYTTHPRLK